jgi:hypothetical protein
MKAVKPQAFSSLQRRQLPLQSITWKAYSLERLNQILDVIQRRGKALQ